MSIQFTPDAPATRRAFNRLAREKMKLRLLADIRMDLMVCKLEGWDKLEYLDELLALLQELRKGGRWGMMITIKAKIPSASMEEIKRIADGIEKIGASSRERINLLLEVGCLLDSNKQNVVTAAADGSIADKSQSGIGS